MEIKFLDFSPMHSPLKEEIKNAFEKFYDSNWFILGKSVDQFEKNYAAFCKTKYSIGVANGLDALVLSLKTLNIKSGDEVIVPSNTYIASWLAVSIVGATPVAVEPNIETYNINPELISKSITEKTKAIMPVHLYGQVCEMDSIIEVAKKYNLFIVEDNAQAHGATYKNKITGSFGDVNATSFYPGKNLGALGDAGAITTNSEALNNRVRLLRNYGSEKKYYNEVQGYNSRLDELQASVLDIKLKHLNSWNNERKQIAEWYNTYLENKKIILPKLAIDCTSVYHLYVIRTKDRDRLKQHLADSKIETLIHYPVAPHQQKAYADYNNMRFGLATEIAKTCLSLPIYPGLSEENVKYISNCINKF